MSSIKESHDNTTTTTSTTTAFDKELAKHWPSGNTILCCGRIILGNDKRKLLFTIILIIIPALMFEAFIATFFYFVHIAAGVVMSVIPPVALTYVFWSLWLTSTMDPGIIPRKSVVFNTYREERKECEELQDKFPPETQEVMVDGKPVVMRYCYTCLLYRPPRSSHCSVCNNCVERFDHHCPWTGTCIAKRNYRPYMHFIGSATFFLVCAILLCLMQIGIVCYRFATMKFSANGATIWQIISTAGAVLIILFCLVALGFVGSLCGYHSYLIATNQTTNERLKKKKGMHVQSHNDGLCCNVFEGYLFAPIEPSRIPFRTPYEDYHVEVEVYSSLTESPRSVTGPMEEPFTAATPRT